MTSPIRITGGTGTPGGHVVPLPRAYGHDVRALTRRPRTAAVGVDYVAGDLLKGEGIESAVNGVRTVLHWRAAPRVEQQLPSAAAPPSSARAVLAPPWTAQPGPGRQP